MNDVTLNKDDAKDIVVTDSVGRRIKERQSKRKGALVFCVACGAINRTLRKWHNSYLCTDCFKIAQNVGDEKFIAALQGKET
jgi:predicted RNA-binding Zn-ribbon protein involved in translation (DUF1610 family)